MSQGLAVDANGNVPTAWPPAASTSNTSGDAPMPAGSQPLDTALALLTDEAGTPPAGVPAPEVQDRSPAGARPLRER
jgi:hypothetical protein